MIKTGIFLLILVLSYSYGIPCSAEEPVDDSEQERLEREGESEQEMWERERVRMKRWEIKQHFQRAMEHFKLARKAAKDAEAAAEACNGMKYQEAVKEARRRLGLGSKELGKASTLEKELSGKGVSYVMSGVGALMAVEASLARAAEAMKKCVPSLFMPLSEGQSEGQLDLKVTGVGTTTGLVCVLTNKTDTAMEVVIPTGTQLITESKGFQPYQTGYNPPIALGPRETVTKEIVALCTDNSLAPAPKDDPSVTYTMPEGPPTPQQEKITELIVTTNQLRQFYSNIGPVAEPDDFLVAGGPPPVTVPTPLEVPKPTEPYGPPEPEPEVYGPPPPAPEEGEEEEEKPPPPEEFPPASPGWWGTWPRPAEVRIVEFFYWLITTSEGLEAARSWYYEYSPYRINFRGDLLGSLEFPGTTQFSLDEVPELKTEIGSRKEKGEAVFSNPTGKVEVSMAPTEDPEIVKFNITKLEARAESLEALGKSRGDINMALNSPEKSTGLLNIETGEVRGTVSVKAWGKEYDKPFPAAATYTGKFDIPTRKLSLDLRGISFEPVEIPQGAYEKANPEKFWESVQLYTIWRETNKVGKEELSKLMEEQFKEKYPTKKARKLGEQVAEEIIGRVDKVYESHKELKEEGIDFSTLDPTLKWRKT